MSTAFSFGPFRLLPAERRLEKEGNTVRLGGRALDLLVVLVERSGEVVSSRALLEAVWRDVLVEESSLRFHIKSLRKVLGDSQPEARYVTNVPGRGYCFVAPVERVNKAEAPASANPSPALRVLPPGRGSAIIGRSDSIETVTRELTQKRIVTVAGPAGIGKTTLAIAIAELLLTRFDNAVVFVDLAPIEDPALVINALASALGVVFLTDERIPTVVDFLRHKRLLIVLDNCEQVIEAVAEVADSILRGTLDPRILVTSREPLRIAGERVHRLMPLECPPLKTGMTADEALGYAAVQLFVDRATASVGDFSLDDALAPAVAEICRRLDGIPLAIELAAARVEFFGVAGLARGLNDMFAVLTQGRRFALPRHQTLRAMLDWGYNLLSPTEQAVLRCLAIFRATFTLEAALAVVVGSRVPFADAVDVMANLVAKSLLSADSTGDTVQYRLLEPTRIYATGKLAASDEGPETARRHAEHLLQLLEQARGNWESDLGDQWLRLCAGRIDDLRAALDWSFSSGGNTELGISLTALSAPLWFALSLTHEYRDRAEFARRRLIEASLSGGELEKALSLSLSAAVYYANGPALSALTDQQRDSATRLRSLWELAGVKVIHGDYRGAVAVTDEYDRICLASGDEAAAAAGDRMKAHVLHLTGRDLEAEPYARRALSRPRFLRSRRWDFDESEVDNWVSSRSHLARILWMRGLGEQAAAAAAEGLSQAITQEQRSSACFILAFSACPIAFWSGNRVAVARYLDIFAQQLAAASLRYWEPWHEAYAHAATLDDNTAEKARNRTRQLISTRSAGDVLLADMLGTIRPELAGPEVVERAVRGESGWCMPEILRARGVSLLQQGQAAEAAAEALFLRSLDIARQRNALPWELRTAMSLARLWQSQDRASAARGLLEAVYARFAEGLDTADLSAARALLASL